MPFQPGFRGRGLVPVFPTVEATQVTNQTNVTTGTVGLPAGIQAGELLIVMFRSSNVTITLPSGWTLLFDEPYNTGTVIRAYAMYKVASGSEGSSVSVTFSGLNTINCVAYRISDFESTPEWAKAEATSTNIDPPNLAPSWGSAKTLWLAAGWPTLAATIGGTPTNYSNKQSTSTMACSERQFQSASDDPSTYTQASSFAFVAATFAIKGTLA